MEGVKPKRVGYWAWPWDTSQMGAFRRHFESQFDGLSLPQPDSNYHGSPEQHEFVIKLSMVELKLRNVFDVAWAEYQEKLNAFSELHVNERRAQGAPKFTWRDTPYDEYKGYSPCRICGLNNGSAEYRFALDGETTFIWPEGYMHYIRDHGVRPDPDFEAAVTAYYEKARLVG